MPSTTIPNSKIALSKAVSNVLSAYSRNHHCVVVLIFVCISVASHNMSLAGTVSLTVQVYTNAAISIFIKNNRPQLAIEETTCPTSKRKMDRNDSMHST